MSIRKEQTLLILVLLLGAYIGQDYFGFQQLVDRWKPQSKEYEVPPLPLSPLVEGEAPALLRRDFLSEPSETRPLPPRDLDFPPHAAASLASLPLDPGPDFQHSWMLRQDGEQVPGVTIERGAVGDGEGADPAALEDPSGAATAASGNPVGGAQAPGAGMSDEQASKLYDRIYVGALKPEYGRIEPQDGVDLFALEDGGDLTGVTLRMRVFVRSKGTMGRILTLGSAVAPITKIVLAQNMRNEVTRQLRKVPRDVASAQNERFKLIQWLLEQARSESWIYEEAMAQAEAYLQYSGGNLDGLRIMQSVLQARGDIEQELAMLEGVQGDATAQSFKLQGIGVIKARLGLWVEAAANLEEAARLTPTDARAHGTLAEFYRIRGRSRDALRAAQRAEQTLGSVQDDEVKARIRRTILSCRLAVGIVADNSGLAGQPPYLRGCTLYASGDMVGALAAFQQVGPGSDASAAQLGQAAVLINTGKFQEAHDQLQQLVDQDPLLRHRALTGLALIFSRLSEFETALTFVDRALEAAPNDTYALYLRGRTLRLMGQFAGAEAALTQALAQNDDFVHAIVEMSLVQAGLADTAIGADKAAFLIGARRYMDRAVALSPST